MSPATLDRLLKPVRFRFKRRGLSTTKPAKLLRTHIPLRDGPANPQQLGHIEADTVAHGGETTAGDFVYSLVFTDVCTGWTEIRAIWNKSARGILEQLKDIESQLPFRMKSFHADNGSEFINWPLWDYLRGPQRKIKFTRSRAYRMQTAYQRLIQRPELAPDRKHRLKVEHQEINPFTLRKSTEQELKFFFTALGNLQCDATNP